MSTLTDTQLLSFVRPLLRASETAKVAAQGVIPIDTKEPASPEDAHERRRVLTVVTSSGFAASSEEGSVFIFKRKSTGELVVDSIVPITHDFQISVAQVAPVGGDGDGADKRPARQANKAPGQFLVTVKSPSRDREFFLLSSSPSLKDVLGECRRLKGSAEADLKAQAPWNKTHHLTTTHAWLEHYQHQLMNISLDNVLGGDNLDPTTTTPFDEHTVPDSLFHPPSLSVPLGKRLSPASAGLPPTSEGATADLILLRDDWIRKQLNRSSREMREKNAPGSSEIRLRICSYNVNGQNPPTREEAVKALGSWIRTQPPGRARADSLPPSETSTVLASETSSIDTKVSDTTPPATPKPPTRGATLPAPGKVDGTNVTVPDIVRVDSPTPIGHRASVTKDETEPDILVVGFQELDLSTEALLYREDPAREEAWTAAIIEALGQRSDGDQYIKVASKQLVGMLIILIATKSVRPRIRDVRTSSAAVGILGLMGNKGAVALRCRVDGTVLTFVSSHLAAFEEMHDKRNYDWREIVRKLVFVPSGIADVVFAAAAEAKTPIFATSPSAPTLTASVPGLETVVNTPAVDAKTGEGKPSGEEGKENPLFEPAIVAASAMPVAEHLRVMEKATIWDSDCVFWNVHLNYRIDLPDLDVRELLGDTSHPTDKHNISTLLKWDQLKNSQRSAKVFEGFEEAEIKFLPYVTPLFSRRCSLSVRTYRFEFGLKADKNGYDIKRKPAWTDRILHMCSDSANVKQTGYSSHPELLLSDHKPISATFEIEPDSMTNATQELLMKTLLHRLGDWILSDEQPNIKIDVQNVDFGSVDFNVPVLRTLRVKNVGKAPCGFRFVPPTEDSAVCEKWLRIEPQWGIILPGESQQVQLTVHVTADNAVHLNSGKRRLEDTLVLHALRGKDHFIAVGGSYKATCFANDLRWLSRLPCPIREYADPTSKKELLGEEQASNAPNEVMRLIAWLMSNALDENDLFLAPGDGDTIYRIREGLDTGEAFEDNLKPTDAKSVADVLVALLDSLPEPVIPWSVQAQCAEVADRDAAFELLGDLPAVNRNVWVSLTAFLHFLVEHAGVESTAKDRRLRALAAVFAPVLLRDNLSTSAVSPLGKRRFLLSFIHG
ncbi:DNase I-like protein [Exidia glandulosa HHB12029]|uniref:DNase I-like protein n=1 Tax=Exidia glandulosa HHB12029 TaxID=1314781 RepID=A0A165E314_EXIGL|nr:DNase I-like protein [Exidia glandulosa HHB12029]